MANERMQPFPKPVNLTLDYVVPESVTSRVATQMTLQMEGAMYVLGFFEVMPPILMGSQDEIEKKLSSMGGTIQARCVAHIYLDPARLVQLHELLGKNLPTNTAKAQ